MTNVDVRNTGWAKDITAGERRDLYLTFKMWTWRVCEGSEASGRVLLFQFGLVHRGWLRQLSRAVKNKGHNKLQFS